ncbi:hypothetical protein RSPO_m00798 (plasmid) [Ralstonia solanacearum Po82]|uniref:Uncharacterized protein n=1 Tax=Ralstonia solanacearum (strain Po82) TaxID=1031711 RepID=F6G8Z6_RALS8|nr:hypothetical protein RSPO_m00798 [Ralstonia solanacearum Po82]
MLYPQPCKKIYFRMFCEVASFALTLEKIFRQRVKWWWFVVKE